MSTRVVVNEQDKLEEKRWPGKPPAPAALKVPANIVSYIFHPLFLPVYVAWFLVRIRPYLFAGFDEWIKTQVIVQTLAMYTFFPLVTVLLLKGLKFIHSVQLHTRRDRIIPYVTCMIYYFWGWHVSKNLSYYPDEFVYFRLAVFIASIVGLMGNSYMKISMHAMAAGVVATFICLIAFFQTIDFGIYITVALLITGLVATARLIVSDHTPREIYAGLLMGVLSQLIAFWMS